jgi:alpha-galactosidase
MGAHISAVPNHQVGRITPVTFRSKVAMMGRFGLELDLGKLDDETLDTLAKEIAQYKIYQQDIHYGDLYRLLSPYRGRTAAYEIVSSKRVLVFIMNITGAPCQAPLRLKLQGLDPDKQYKNVHTGVLYDGRALMGAGIPLDTRKDHQDALIVFEICP